MAGQYNVLKSLKSPCMGVRIFRDPFLGSSDCTALTFALEYQVPGTSTSSKIFRRLSFSDERLFSFFTLLLGLVTRVTLRSSVAKVRP